MRGSAASTGMLAYRLAAASGCRLGSAVASLADAATRNLKFRNWGSVHHWLASSCPSGATGNLSMNFASERITQQTPLTHNCLSLQWGCRQSTTPDQIKPGSITSVGTGPYSASSGKPLHRCADCCAMTRRKYRLFSAQALTAPWRTAHGKYHRLIESKQSTKPTFGLYGFHRLATVADISPQFNACASVA